MCPEHRVTSAASGGMRVMPLMSMNWPAIGKSLGQTVTFVTTARLQTPDAAKHKTKPGTGRQCWLGIDSKDFQSTIKVCIDLQANASCIKKHLAEVPGFSLKMVFFMISFHCTWQNSIWHIHTLASVGASILGGFDWKNRPQTMFMTPNLHCWVHVWYSCCRLL